jgi:TPR repeat protein
MKWLLKAASDGNGDAADKIGNLYLDVANSKQSDNANELAGAVKFFQQAADVGNTDAQTHLGFLYSRGIGVPPDMEEAVKWWRKAAEKGDSRAQFSLGLSYDTGRGVKKDPTLAMAWYLKAADHGIAAAQRCIGFDYLLGIGVDQDYEKAATWLRKAAVQGDVSAQAQLGNLCNEGHGVPKDFDEGLKWNLKAANQGDAEGERNVGLAYEEGQGIEQNVKTAAEWYRKAAEKGNADGETDLGLLFLKGSGVEKDHSEAAKWLLKASEQGVTGSQYNLGLLYYYGDGVPQDFVEALAWIIVSASEGGNMAEDTLPKLEAKVGLEVTMRAQQRSKELLKDIERSKAQSGNAPRDGLGNQATGDQPQSSGTGVFISKDGLVITAAHVVKNALSIKVVTQQGVKTARIIKIDVSNDVALLKCEGQFQAVPIKSSSGIKLGQAVFTVGFPDIQLQGFSPKMTQGEISSLSGIQDDPRDWQISVPVQPGNSGGPLFDANGNVVGLVVGKLDALITAQATGALPEDINYAVKTAYILPLLDAYTSNLVAEAPATATPEKTEDVVGRVQNSVVLILAY